MKPYRIGIVGGGVIAKYHVAAIRALEPHLEIGAVADAHPESRDFFSASQGVPLAYDSLTAMREGTPIDIVIVCTPPSTHESLVAEALEAGCYVACEKPLTPTLSSANRLLQTTAKYPGRLSTVHQLRYQDDFHAMTRIMQSGKLGKPIHATISKPNTFNFEGNQNPWWGKWDIAGGGIVMTQFIHYLDLCALWFGMPDTVEGEMKTAKLPIESEDEFRAEFIYSSG